MSNLARQPEHYTVEEYLYWERIADVRHEYYDGQIVMMAGGSPRHSLLGANLIAEFHRAVSGSGCRVYTSDLKIRSSPSQFVYPDVTVVCGELQFHDAERDVVTNPRLIVEVLSPTTETTDRGVKWLHYQRLSMLRDYLMVSQQEPIIEHYYRDEHGEWQSVIHQGLETIMNISALDCAIPLHRIYDGIEF